MPQIIRNQDENEGWIRDEPTECKHTMKMSFRTNLTFVIVIFKRMIEKEKISLAVVLEGKFAD